MKSTRNLGLLALLACGLLLIAGQLQAHGGVVMEEDQCIIDIGLFRAHFTIYQPQTRASEEFCEEVPDLGETLFVMDYLHDSLSTMVLEFRIIHDVNGSEKYASLEDVQSIRDLDAVTVYHQAPRVEASGSMTTQATFEREGWYIGVVSTRHPTLDKEYHAVFGFHVGGRGIGWLLPLLLIAGLVQLHFWHSSGGLSRWRKSRANSNPGGDRP